MNLTEAKKILEPWITNKGLHSLSAYIDWEFSDYNVTLDGMFDVETLEAIVVFIKETKS